MAYLYLQHVLQPFDVLSVNPEVVTQERITEDFTCRKCGQSHSVLYWIERKVGKQFGHYMAFMINGEWDVIDPTLPHDVEKLPRDAKKVRQEIAENSWHNNMHYFYLIGDDGKVLRNPADFLEEVYK